MWTASTQATCRTRLRTTPLRPSILRLCASTLVTRPAPLRVHSREGLWAVLPAAFNYARAVSASHSRNRSSASSPASGPASATAVRHASLAFDQYSEEVPLTPPFTAGPYSTLTVGIPRETYPGERRVAVTPKNVKILLKKGFSRVLVERSAGVEAQFTDEAYEQAGAKTVDRRTVFSQSDILLKVRAPSVDGPDSEVDALREGATIISFLYPAQNRHVVDRIASRGTTSFAMDMVPRISRAQVFDALRYFFAIGTMTVMETDDVII